jgi:DNA-binding CsgD family transcriptional regulator
LIKRERSKLSVSIARLRAATTSLGLEQTLYGIRDIYGFKHLAFLSVRLPRILDIACPYCTTYPREWTAHYVKKNYFTVDPVVQLYKSALMPVDWASLDRTSNEVARFFKQANTAGVGRQGLTIPVRGPAGERSIFSATSDRSARQWRRFANAHRHDLMLISHYVHERFADLHRLRSKNYKSLSTREQQCLELLAQGIAPKLIAWTLKISESAVRLYLGSAKRKLQTTTIYQAIARASALELIDV